MPTTISGHVLDNKFRPVGHVTISLNGKPIGATQVDGYFSVTLSEAQPRASLTFKAAGYVSNTRVFDGKVGGGGTVVVWPFVYSTTFDSSQDLDIEFGSTRIKIPAKALTNADGSQFGGRAKLEYTLFDITSPFQRAAASGDYSGRLKDGSLRRLNSYGIFDLTVSDPRGLPLNLAKGAVGVLSIGIPPKLVQHAPKTVGFFDFSEADALWIQTGVFEFDPNALTYNGTIHSMGGAHNLDDPQDNTCIAVRVINAWNATPMANMTVVAQGPNWTSSGTSNANGYVCLIVQMNASFTVNAYGQVGSSSYATPNQPTFTSPNFSSGAADCGDPVRCPLLGNVVVDLIVGLNARNDYRDSA